MEKEKKIQQHKDFKENFIKESRNAARRMNALEQWHQDRMDMMKAKKEKQRNERYLMHTGHREIIKQIERDLKRENEQRMAKLSMKYRRQQVEIENDLGELTDKIVQVYKKY